MGFVVWGRWWHEMLPLSSIVNTRDQTEDGHDTRSGYGEYFGLQGIQGIPVRLGRSLKGHPVLFRN